MKYLLLPGLLLCSSASALASSIEQPTKEKPQAAIKFKQTVNKSAPVKLSKPLKEKAVPFPLLTPERRIKLQQSGDKIPGVDFYKEVPNRFPDKDKKYQQPDGFVDKAAQVSFPPMRNVSIPPEMGVSFDGIPNVMGYVPPDTNGDVGRNHYVQMLNSAIAVWDKAGNQILEPTAINLMWEGFGGICESNNDGDPIVLYDAEADRWMISQFALDFGANDFHECIAISTTGDPSGSYYLYDFPYGSKMNDYPHFGIWTDGYYMGVNQFTSGFAGGAVVAYERDKMLVGAQAQQIIIDMEGSNPEVFTPMPFDMDGFLPPPAGAPEYVIWSDFDTLDKLHVWEFDVDWDNVENTTFTPVTEIEVTPYNGPALVVQPNGVTLDSLGLRSMFRAAYRNLNGQSKVVFTHNVAAPAGQGIAATRWYEIDVDYDNGSAELVQESTFAPDEHSRWMSSAAMDAMGNIAVGYSIASESMMPSIAAATRLVTDPLNQLTNEIILHEGGGAQGPVNRSRWGDYTSMSIDPTDDCTFWYTNQYYTAQNTDTLSWSTRIASFKIPTCAAELGTVTGRVIDAETQEPLPHATIHFNNITTTTDIDGYYTADLPVAEYGVSASIYGWVTSQAVTTNVEEDATVNVDIQLAVAPRTTVSGVVTADLADSPAAGNMADVAGRPVYTQVNVNVPGNVLTTFTHPETGEYSIELVQNTTVEVEISPEAESGFTGYQSNWNIEETPLAFDIALPVNSNCSVPGTEPTTYVENFDVFPPAGWSVTDEVGSGVVWSAYSAIGNNRMSWIAGDAAFIDSDAAGPGVSADSSLISRVIGVDEIASQVLNFSAQFRTFTGADRLDVDILVDGQEEWTNVATLAATDQREQYAFDLSATLTGATSFQLRFHYYNAVWEYYAAIDGISFGEAGCRSMPGSFVSGYVTDANTGEPLNGAAVSTNGEFVVSTINTEADEALADGFFQAFVPAEQSLTVAKVLYSSATVEASDISLATPIALEAGQLSTESDGVSETVTQGREAKAMVTFTNIGSASIDSVASLLVGQAEPEMPNGPFHPAVRHYGPKNTLDKTSREKRHFPDYPYAALELTDVVNMVETQASNGFGLSLGHQAGGMWLSDMNVVREYSSELVQTGNTIAVPVEGDNYAAGITYNHRTGTLWQVVAGDNCIHELQPQQMIPTGQTICPDFANTQRGLAYDPVSNTYYSGSLIDGIIHQFTPEGVIFRSVNVDLDIVGLAFNSSTNHLLVSVNGEKGSTAFDIAVIDTESYGLDVVDTYTLSADVDGDQVVDYVMSDYGQAGIDLACDGSIWMVDQVRDLVVSFNSPETGACDWRSVDWLSVTMSADSVAVEGTLNAELTMDTTQLDVGEHQAQLVLLNSTPYGNMSVPVSVTVTEPEYGMLGFESTVATVSEDGEIEITVMRTDGADFPVSIDYTSVEATAVADQDFTPVQGTLSWADMDSEPKTITVSANQLQSVDGEPTFLVQLSNPQGGAEVAANQATVVTIENLPNGVFDFAISSITANEDGTVNVQVTRTGGANFAASVDFATVNGTATAGSDYVEASGTLTWEDQESDTKTIEIQTRDVGGDVTFEVVLSNPSTGAALGATSSTQVTIQDRPSSGGSMGPALLAILALITLGRRRVKM